MSQFVHMLARSLLGREERVKPNRIRKINVTGSSEIEVYRHIARDCLEGRCLIHAAISALGLNKLASRHDYTFTRAASTW